MGMSPFSLIPMAFMNLMFVLLSFLVNNFYLVWVFMELGMFSFIMMMILDMGKSQVSNSLKYFSFQALSSVLILLSAMLWSDWSLMIFLLLLFKLGMAPFHLWFMAVTKNMHLFLFFWISSVQKMIPFRLMSIFAVNINFSENVILIISIILSSLNMLIQTKLLGLFASSSVFSSNWVVLSIVLNPTYAMAFFLVYLVIQAICLMLVYSSGLNPQSSNNSMSSLSESFTMVMLMLFMAGFPPSPLFFVKIYSMSLFMLNNIYLISFILMLSSAVINFTYLSIFITKLNAESRLSFIKMSTKAQTISFSSILLFLSFTTVFMW